MKRIIVTMLVGLLATTAWAEERVWTSADGANKIPAEYIGMKDGKVLLRLQNGKVAQADPAKLSPADREYLANLPEDAGKVLKVEDPNKPQKVNTEGLLGDDRFSQAILEDENNPDAWNTRGMALLNRGKVEEAMKHFNKALELDPKSPVAYNERGRAHMKSGDFAKAHNDFSKAIENDENFAPAYKNRADNAPDFYDTPAGKQMLAEHEAAARKKRDAIAKKYLQKFPWQPPNSTTDKSLNSSAIRNIRNMDYAMAERLEREYRPDWGWGGHGGYGGHGHGHGHDDGCASCGGQGCEACKVKLNGALEVFPPEVERGDYVELVANPSELSQGMPVQVGPGAPKPKRGQAPPKQEVAMVDFYRDIDGDGKLDKEKDSYLASDLDGSDGFSARVSTEEFQLGNQAYFAVPKGKGSGEEADKVTLTLNENLLRASAEAERQIQESCQSCEDGLAAPTAEALAKEQQRLAGVVNDVAKDLKQSAPEVAAVLDEAKKSIGETSAQLRKAKSSPGTKAPARNAGDAAETVADQLEKAASMLAELTGSGEEGEGAAGEGAPGSGEGAPGTGEGGPGSGQPQKPPKPPYGEANAGAPAVASGEVIPPKGGAPGGPGGPGGPGYGGPGGDGADVVNNYYGDRFGDDDDVVIDRAQDYIEDGDYDRAIVDYDYALRDNPFDADVLRERAYAHSLNGGYDYAIRDYDRLVQVAPRNADFYYNRGCAHLAAGHLDQAMGDFTMSIKLDELGKLGNLAFNNRGSTYARQGEYVKAIEDFNTALEIDAADHLAYRNRALAYKKLGKLQEAQADFILYKKYQAERASVE